MRHQTSVQGNKGSSGKNAMNSKVISSAYVDVRGTEETEIQAVITVPTDGGWGWVVVAAAFTSVMIVDGALSSYGALLKDIAQDYGIDDATAAIAGSMQNTLSVMLSPLVSALINRFGFRTCAMTGSIICCYSCIASTLARSYASFFFLYGAFYGIGACFVFMSSNLISGFYFEKYRSIALVLVTAGSSVGVMVVFPLFASLVSIGGWRPTILLHSGLLGLIYFFGLTYRPLVSVAVVQLDEEENPTKTVTFLPTMTDKAAGLASRTERAFGAVSNINFPTAAAVIKDDHARLDPSVSEKAEKQPKLVVTARSLSRAQMNQVRSMVSRAGQQEQPNVQIAIEVEPEKKKSCLGRLCHWHPNNTEARPMYRDDVFYDGNVERLPEYQKSVVMGDQKTGLEYQMAVTRAVTVNDINDKKGFFTASVRRVLATMCDFQLLKRPSFLLYCLSGLSTYLGIIVPYVYTKDRNLENGVHTFHCNLFVSVMGLFNLIGRFIWSAMSLKVNPIYIYIIGLIIAGISVGFSTVSYNVPYQYFYSAVFGMTSCVTTAMRSLIIVDLYGLDRLTNAYGMLGMFLGLGYLVSSPTAGVIKDTLGYTAAFGCSGFVIALSGFLAIPVLFMVRKERKKLFPEPEEGKETNANVEVPQQKSADPDVDASLEKKGAVGKPRTSFQEDNLINSPSPKKT